MSTTQPIDIDNGGPAFPVTIYDFQPTTGDQVVREQCGGMTLRDYFAAKALQGMCAVTGVDFGGCEGTAKIAYKLADAMLAQRNKP